MVALVTIFLCDLSCVHSVQQCNLYFSSITKSKKQTRRLRGFCRVAFQQPIIKQWHLWNYMKPFINQRHYNTVITVLLLWAMPSTSDKNVLSCLSICAVHDDVSCKTPFYLEYKDNIVPLCWSWQKIRMRQYWAKSSVWKNPFSKKEENYQQV